MSLGRRPSKQRADLLRQALIGSRDGAADQQIAMQIWNNLRWRIQTMPERTYPALQALIDQAIVDVEAKVKTPSVKNAIVEKLSQMRNRTTEFNTEEEATDEHDPDENPGADL